MSDLHPTVVRADSLTALYGGVSRMVEPPSARPVLRDFEFPAVPIHNAADMLQLTAATNHLSASQSIGNRDDLAP